MAKEKLAKAKREPKAAVEKYKAFLDFTAKMAHAVVAF